MIQVALEKPPLLRPSRRKPYYWKSRRGWYVKLPGSRSQVFLARDNRPRRDAEGNLVVPKAALQRYRQVMAQQGMLVDTSTECGFDIPPQLTGIPFIKEFRSSGPCVYFLVLENEVIYVGQTVSLARRVVQHATGSSNDPPKVFSNVYYIPVEKRKLDETERYYIRALSPRLNGGQRRDNDGRS